MSFSFSTSLLWRYLRRYLGPFWRRVLLLALLLFAGIALQLANPQLVRYLIDTASAGGSLRALGLAAALFILFAFLKQITSLSTTYLSEDVGWAATNRLRADLALHCVTLDMPFHKAHTPGELLERIDGDVSQLADLFSRLVVHIGGNALLAVGILLLLLREDLRLGLVTLGFGLLLVGVLQAASRPVTAASRQARQVRAALSSYLEERLVSLEDIRASGAEAHVLHRLYPLMRELMQRYRCLAVLSNLAYNGGHVLFVLARIAALALGAALYLRGQMTIGTVFMVMSYVQLLQAPLDEIRRQVTDLQQALASIGRIHEILQIQPEVSDLVPTDPRARTLPAGPLSVSLSGVHFGYDEQTQVLRGLSLDLAPGQVLGLLGRTGSGKTTITRLLFRLYDPTAGSVQLGGVELRDVPLSELRRRVGLVTQDVQLFAASVRDNLTFFDKSVSDARLLAVIRELGLDEWLRRLPAGLDTTLGAGGLGLSAGEAQLLALARVFLHDPGLVILDEASSRLDPATEQLVERALDRLLQGRTGVIIAHRLGTVQRADTILILEGGSVAEYGPRQALAHDPTSRFAALLKTGLEEVLA